MSFLSFSCMNFRNLKDATVDIGYPQVFLVGRNGQGKTNFLEALYISSYGASFRNVSEQQIVNNLKDGYNVKALYKKSDEVSHVISVNFFKGKKEIEKDMKRISRKDLVNTIPCILFYTSDIEFINGSQTRKRFFFDQCLSMYDKGYLSLLHTYLKVLAARNTVIKSQCNLDLIDTYNIQFAVLALSILKKRLQLIEELNLGFSSLYENITGISGVKIKYDSTIPLCKENELIQILQKKMDQELRMGISLAGPHRDKITFIQDRFNFDKSASNGQKRILSLVLRMLQARFYTEKLKSKPVILMDDVMLELDNEKKQKIMSLLPPYEQLFCTFLKGEMFRSYISKETKIFFVEDGILDERN